MRGQYKQVNQLQASTGLAYTHQYVFDPADLLLHTLTISLLGLVQLIELSVEGPLDCPAHLPQQQRLHISTGGNSD